MARYKYKDTRQGLFLTVNLKEQLVFGSFEWTLDYLLDRIDMSAFDSSYHNDLRGAAAYAPGIMLKIILYCYSKGILSSRRIQAACREHMIVKALAEDSEPDHATIAAFISSNHEAVQDIFMQILMKCQRLDLISGEMFAIDGCKLSSNASKRWTGKLGDLQKRKIDLEKHMEKILKRHTELDRDEAACKKLDEYRKTLGKEQARRERHIKRIEKAVSKIDTFLQNAEPKRGAGGMEVQTNITDQESAYIKSSAGYIQGYNGIAIADSKSQVIIAARAIGSGPEQGCFPAMLERLEGTMQKLTKKRKPLSKALCLGDTGYFSEENLQTAKQRNINVLIPDPQFRKRDSSYEWKRNHAKKKKYEVTDFQYDKKADLYICPAGKILSYKCTVKLRNNEGRQYRASGKDCKGCALKEQCMKRGGKKQPGRTLYIVDKKYEDNMSEAMKRTIDKPEYRELYSRRIQIIEPVFANMRYWKGMNRFTLRSQEKVNTQWGLYAIVHNIGKSVIPLAKKLRERVR